MFRILLKKQMTEIFRAYFYDAKKNKKRSVFSTVLFFGFFIILMVGIVGGMFAYLADSLCKPFAMVNMKWLYFLIMGMIAIALGTFGSVFNTYSGLYLSKDNDLLLSMPIPIRSILTIRLVSVYLMGLMYSAIVMLPAVIVYWIEVEATPLTVVGPVLLILLISLLVLILSCVLGWCVAKISLKLKNKSFITVILSLCFFALYYFVYFKAQDLIQNLLMNAAVYGEKVKGSAYPVYLFGKIGEGDLLAMLLYTAVIAVLCALTFVVLSRSFIKIATSSGSVKKVVYKEKKEKRKTPFMAILQKEFGRFLSSPNYMLNCGLGVIALPIVGVVMLFKGNDILDFMNMIFGSEREGMLIVLVVTALSLLASMNDMVVPSVSLEGKNISVKNHRKLKARDFLWTPEENQDGIRRIELHFDEERILYVMEDERGRHEVLAGLDHWIDGMTTMTGASLHHQYEQPVSRIAAIAYWSDEDTLMMEWRFPEMAFFDHLSIYFEEEQVKIDRWVNMNSQDRKRPTLVIRKAF